jgi:hypothetical protein
MLREPLVKKYCSIFTFTTRHPTYIGLVLNPSLRGENPVTISLKHDTIFLYSKAVYGLCCCFLGKC